MTQKSLSTVHKKIPIGLLLGSLFSILATALLYTFFRPIIPPNETWMDKVINREFSAFQKEGISKDLLESTWKNCQKIKEFKRFTIIDSTVYGDNCRMKNLLEAIAAKYTVPDVDFIYYYEDRLKPDFFTRSSFKNCAPIFVSAKNKHLHRAVLFADWVYDIKNDHSGWNFLIPLMNQLQSIPWAAKTEKLFWRGTPWDGKHFGMYNFENWTTIPRGKLVYQSRKHPERIDAAFSEYPQKCVKTSLERCKEEMGEIRFASWPEVMHYKYHMAIDGVTCSFPATQWKLLSGGLTFKQETQDIMYFYSELIPWTHYIPIKANLSDLLEKIEWAKTHDAEAEQIAKNGRQFVLDHLMPEHIMEYCYKALVKYASLQKFQPYPDPNK